MQMHSARAAAPSMPQPFCKAPRAHLARLEVETDVCPQVLLRVLGLLAQRWIMPLSIEAMRGDASQRLTVEIETLPEAQADALVARIEAVVMVRAARIVAVEGGPPSPGAGAVMPSANYLVQDGMGG